MLAAVILNAQAGEGDSRAAEVREELARRGVPVAWARALHDPAGLRSAIGEALAAGVDLVVVGGGDGTLATAAGVLAGGPATLGVLPLGTANDFARGLGIPPELGGACDVIAAGEPRTVDVARAGDRAFLNAASVGLSSEVTARMTQDLKRRAGPLAYPIVAASSAVGHEPFRARLTIDGVAHALTAVQIVVGNGRFHGGGVEIAPGARNDDRRLDVWALATDPPHEQAPRGRWRRLADLCHLGFLLHRGRHLEHPDVCHWRAREVRLETEPPMEVDVDGETGGHTPIVLRVSDARLRVLAARVAPATTDGALAATDAHA